ncbi:MAG: amidohydrolase family protein [Ignavibacteriae bacterium]|nr:amidohydrolase family protein [Ignavibacteriota bacterium]
MKSILIKNGFVCFEEGIRQADIYIQDGKISLINSQANTDEIIDAEGFYVLPGMIDIHTHLDDTIGNYYLADTYKSGSEGAVLNGFTTLFTFITQGKNETLKQAIDKAKEKSEGKPYCDFMWHLTPISFDEENWEEIYKCIEKGFKTIKFYTTYESTGIYSSYEKLEKIFKKLSKYNLTFLVHCEDNDIIKIETLKNYNLSNPYSQALLRPKEAEIEAIKKLIEIAKKYNVKLHIVHVSTSEGAEMIYKAKKDMSITCETAPHYLFLNDEYLKKENGYRWICSPPLRDEKNMLEMQSKARDGYFDIYATDHCAFTRKVKDENFISTEPNITKVPNGLAGIGALPHLTFKLYSDNFNNAVFELSKRLSLNPAKITGIYPRKGVIKDSSDADLVILNPNGVERKIKSSLSDVYETYPDLKTKLNFKNVFVRGEMVVENDKIVGKETKGKCLI